MSVPYWPALCPAGYEQDVLAPDDRPEDPGRQDSVRRLSARDRVHWEARKGDL